MARRNAEKGLGHRCAASPQQSAGVVSTKERGGGIRRRLALLWDWTASTHWVSRRLQRSFVGIP